LVEEVCAQKMAIHGRFEKPHRNTPTFSSHTILLGRVFSHPGTPVNVHETARLRIATAGQNAAETQRIVAGGNGDRVAALVGKVQEALTRGASIQCPCCGTCACTGAAVHSCSNTVHALLAADTVARLLIQSFVGPFGIYHQVLKRTTRACTWTL
jgi:hypothetical protein